MFEHVSLWSGHHVKKFRYSYFKSDAPLGCLNLSAQHYHQAFLGKLGDSVAPAKKSQLRVVSRKYPEKDCQSNSNAPTTKRKPRSLNTKPPTLKPIEQHLNPEAQKPAKCALFLLNGIVSWLMSSFGRGQCLHGACSLQALGCVLV